MPIKIPNQLPATQTLRQENIFVMTETRAITQDIRPLRILLLNLMPTKVDTETQFARVLGNTPLQIELELVAPRSHVSKNTSQEHMLAFYKTFDKVKDQNFDGLIITGAPVEQLPFEEVDYWPELCRIMEWSKTHVHSTLHICWGAQAGLYYHYGLKKRQEKLKQEISGQSVILFHEAYAYVAEDYGLQVNYLLDLDEERQVSAGEVSDVLSAVRKGHVKYILAEELYGKSMGDTIRKESDAKVLYLDPLNRGTYEKDSYINGMKKNMEILGEAFYAKDH